MKIIIIGSRGQLGSDLVKVFPKGIGLNRPEIDITNTSTIYKAFLKYNPDIVINTAAFHQVDKAETEPETAFQVNGVGVYNLAQVCRQKKAKLIHISTDYAKKPQNVYAVSKLAGEMLVESNLLKYLIIRTSSLFGVAGPSGKGNNFIETMINLGKKKKEIKVVTDVYCQPTYTFDLATAIRKIITAKKWGQVIDICNSGSTNYYDFAKEIFNQIGIDVKIKKQYLKDVKGAAIRPKKPLLCSFLKLRPWQEALADYLQKRSYL